MKYIRILLPIVILAIGVGGFMLLKASKSAAKPVQVKERIWRVDTIAAVPQRRSPQVLLYGKVEAPGLVKAAAPANAVVQSVSVAEGQHVRKSAPLLALDERDFLPQVEQLEAQITLERNRHSTNQLLLDQEKRLLQIARDNESRVETLLQRNLGSQATLDEARRATQSQRIALTQRQLEIDNHGARLQNLKAQLTQARTQLERSQLVAPFDAIIVKVNVSQGNQVRSGDTLITYYAPEDIEVRAQIPAPYESMVLAALAKQQGLTASSDNGMSFVFDRVSGQASTQGIEALFEPREPIGRGDDITLLVGQQLSLQLSLPEQENSVLVPSSALYGNNRVYLLNQGRMESVVVERLGQLTVNGSNRLLVRSNRLDPGSEIITTHLPNAVTGLRVQSSDSREQQSQ